MTVPRQAVPVGRFAPTPSGPLHAGSLATALGSWLAARRQAGRWLVRFDDLDTPRNQPGAMARIDAQLARHGLEPDATACSSELAPGHAAALAELHRRGLVYPCNCTRARLREQGRPGPWGPVYDGHCLRQPPPTGRPVAWRFHLPPRDVITFVDAALGPQAACGADLGDPVVRRADGVTGYALACAVDEQALGVTQVARGADLLGATFAQVAIAKALAHSLPRYAHLPLVAGADGRKLSKQNHATPLVDGRETDNLRAAARHLGCDADALPGLDAGHEIPPATLLAGLLSVVRDDPPPWCRV